MTELYRRLRAAERFGISPLEMDTWPPGLRTLIMDFDTLRRAEEAHEHATLLRFIARDPE